ncbi:MAG: hypothetical protein IIC81_05740 [Chloroflexi bacterium]|nr:hypothetical protein [Chloroflexota bacterium]
MRGTVKELNNAHIRVAFDNGDTKWIPVSTFKQVRLGYAFTNHRFQGSGINYVYAVVGGSMTDYHSFYVQITRGFQDVQIFSTKALLGENPNPTRDEVREALAGNLCRCSGYTKIIDAVMAVRGAD